MNFLNRMIKSFTGKRDVNLSGSNNLFGTIGANVNPIISRMNFIPEDNKGNTIQLTGEGDTNRAQWIGLSSKAMQFWAYVYCSPLATVIDRLAEADTNGRIRFIDEDTEVPIKNVSKIPRLARIRKLLKKPNPWQTWAEFEGEQIIYSKIFGYCPVFAIGPATFDRSYTKALVNICPLLVTPIRNEEFDLFKGNSRIKQWDLNIDGKTYNIPDSDIMLIKDGWIGKTDELGLPLSKVNGLDFSVSNICAAMEADNVILKKKGPLGIFSYDPAKDSAGAVPFEPGAKDDLQEDLKRYGLTVGQIQYVISKMPVKWNAMSFNLRDLMTKEVIREAIDRLSDRFNYPAELMSGKNATYENRNSSEKFVYQNNVIPFSLRRIDVYNDFFELHDGAVLNKTFDHIPVLQEDVVRAGEAENYESMALDIDWKNGMITWNQWQVIKERDPVAGMDIYYPDYIKKYPQMDTNKPKTDGKTTTPKNTSTKK